MNGFVGFMQSWIGRLLRVVAGLALIAVGLFVMQGVWGYVVAAIGLIPLFAGVVGICLLAPLFGYTLAGEPRRRTCRGRCSLLKGRRRYGRSCSFASLWRRHSFPCLVVLAKRNDMILARSETMWAGILWPAAVVLLEAITFVAMVLLIRLAIRDHEREQAVKAQSEDVQAGEATEEAPLTGSRAA